MIASIYSHAKGSLQVMLTLSMIILHLMKISSIGGSFSNHYKNTMFTVISIGFL